MLQADEITFPEELEVEAGVARNFSNWVDDGRAMGGVDIRVSTIMVYLSPCGQPYLFLQSLCWREVRTKCWNVL